MYGKGKGRVGLGIGGRSEGRREACVDVPPPPSHTVMTLGMSRNRSLY